ncbi:Acetyltransferase (GNAT) family protein [Thermomonospora echinospora]|uniref:Acetyltransferase (GNAT) family protein n=1 Tax=Thermomonospora echinospora TaxID=1992 RepID=A0A1H6DZB8_9ACTN|nr:GNAT family N-acetyltransferase [Thermomonospora echinospora]SEG90687.1 Acetyltransferase (GNAT) family protein [Thermomonospora echinospora]
MVERPERPERKASVPAVREAGVADVPVLSRVLARAFDDDPVWRWMFPGPRVRLDRMAGLFSIELRHVHLPLGATEVAGRGGRIEAGAMWDPPGRWRTPLPVLIRQFVPLARLFGTRTVPVLRTLTAIEKQHPAEPHWYLSVIGTDPAAQGNGLGGRLLESRLSRCDEEGLPAYLESSKESNVPFYEKYGFRVTRTIRPPGGCPPVWAMWRDPGASG